MPELLESVRLNTLKGIGDKNEKLFERVGVTDLNQLLHFYPRTYDVYSEPVTYDKLISGEKNAIYACITRPPIVKSGKKSVVTVLTLMADFQMVEVIWYHMPYLRSILKKGSVFIFRGLVVKRSGKWVMEHPEIFTNAAYEQIKGTIQPIYSLTSGLSNKAVQKAVRQLFEKFEFDEYLPNDIRNEYNLIGRNDALYNIHFPISKDYLFNARKRIVFDEFLIFLLGIKRLNASVSNKHSDVKITSFEYSNKVLETLPYKLTNAQNKVWDQIKKDLYSGELINRLVQGDVGSGKTIICFLAMLTMSENGYQSALMAPTEVLASQHYKSLCKLLDDNNIDERPVLLTGSLKASEKKQIQEDIKSGNAKLIIGTHALIQKNVSYENLGLVITDEQQRFGVRQRSDLNEKGTSEHVIVMSATPIPRTLALILYGDLQISLLDEMPTMRLPIKNAVVDTNFRDKAYKFIAKEVKCGHQAYIVCPMIEKNEDFPCESVIEYTKKLQAYYKGIIKVKMLHGRMTSDEKEEIMKDFKDGKTDILVSTTVIEVGVDVPNATVMMIENADRFGLSQLHQLRGRIGRGDTQGYCIFVKSDGKDDINERLDVIGNSNDGFYIAEEDMKMRGHGDLFGLRQSGMYGFSLADIYADKEILEMAAKAADGIISEDTGLTSPKYEGLLKIINKKTSDTLTGL